MSSLEKNWMKNNDILMKKILLGSEKHFSWCETCESFQNLCSGIHAWICSGHDHHADEVEQLDIKRK